MTIEEDAGATVTADVNKYCLNCHNPFEYFYAHSAVVSVECDVPVREPGRPGGRAAVGRGAGGAEGGGGDRVRIPGEHRPNPEREPESEEETAPPGGPAGPTTRW